MSEIGIMLCGGRIFTKTNLVCTSVEQQPIATWMSLPSSRQSHISPDIRLPRPVATDIVVGRCRGTGSRISV